MSQSYDVLVAGGGVSGILSAARILTANPSQRVVILEKDSQIGGRVRSGTKGDLDALHRRYGYGLSAVSDRLFDFVDQTLKNNPDTPDLTSLVGSRQTRIAVLAGNKLSEHPIASWFSPKGARLLGGFAASRQWPLLTEILDKADPDSTFAQNWKLQRKAPAAIVLEHFASALGIPDIWGASPAAIVERASAYTGQLHNGEWDDAIEALVQIPSFQKGVTVLPKTLIVEADYRDGRWSVRTEGGEFAAKRLIVAQPPWQALTWLPRHLWPPTLLSIANKTRPVSAVILTEKRMDLAFDLPDVTLVPAERTQIINDHSTEIYFQATIDFEQSMQAPEVLKAVRRLKRARRKLLAIAPKTVSQTDHVALQPVAWAPVATRPRSPLAQPNRKRQFQQQNASVLR